MSNPNELPTRMRVFASAPCACASCANLRTADRSAAVARYAAERGLPVASGPRVALTGEQMEARAALIRARRAAVTLEPMHDEAL